MDNERPHPAGGHLRLPVLEWVARLKDADYDVGVCLWAGGLVVAVQIVDERNALRLAGALVAQAVFTALDNGDSLEQASYTVLRIMDTIDTGLRGVDPAGGDVIFWPDMRVEPHGKLD